MRSGQEIIDDIERFYNAVQLRSHLYARRSDYLECYLGAVDTIYVFAKGREKTRYNWTRFCEEELGCNAGTPYAEWLTHKYKKEQHLADPENQVVKSLLVHWQEFLSWRKMKWQDEPLESTKQ